MKNILKEICDRRLSDIAQKGYSYAHEIPEKRIRPVVPFLPDSGTILEVKRASPSKGDIAPDLDPVKTAENYIAAGTSAISVLTEENYFKGSLEDLKKVAALSDSLGNKAAVLRKDFLLEPEEIEVAYKCGADAVLLIARILELEKLLQMAQKAFELGISILLELRDEEAVEKAFHVLKLAKKMDCEDRVVLGVNARDLKTFTIDMLIPLKIKCLIEEKFLALTEKDRPSKIRIISESGVLTKEASLLTGTLGFDGILIGEAVAKSPENAAEFVSSFLEGSALYHESGKESFWKLISEKLNRKEKTGKPLVKICGITNSDDGICAAENGADLIGFIFEEKFSRHVDLNGVKTIVSDVRKYCSDKKIHVPAFVAVITDTESSESHIAQKYLSDGIVNAIQFHGCRGNAISGYEVIKVFDDESLRDLEKRFVTGSVRVLIDAFVAGAEGGTGKQIPDNLVEKASTFGKLWLAGGINCENVKSVIERFNPELIDVSSGVESAPGKKDHEKIRMLFSRIGSQVL